MGVRLGQFRLDSLKIQSFFLKNRKASGIGIGREFGKREERRAKQCMEYISISQVDLVLRSFWSGVFGGEGGGGWGTSYSWATGNVPLNGVAIPPLECL